MQQGYEADLRLALWLDAVRETLSLGIERSGAFVLRSALFRYETTQVMSCSPARRC